MTGILAQIITITSFGNEYLKNGKLTGFYPKNSVFQHCDFVNFTELRKKNIFSPKKEVTVSKNPMKWFEYLKSKNCKKLRLYYQPFEKDNSEMVGFVVGDGIWYIETIYTTHSDFWAGSWSYQKNLIEKPWQVTYRKAIEKQPTINKQFDIKETRENLRTCLMRIGAFAYKETTDNWGKTFQKAKEALESINSVSNFHQSDFICWENYDLQNQQLIVSTCKAYVFGGMGSWNDMGFENEEIDEKYNKLSIELYTSIMESIICAINKDHLE